MRQNHWRSRSSRAVLACLALTLSACVTSLWRASPDSTDAAKDPRTATTPEAKTQRCHDLKAEIAWYEKQRRVAPPLTNSPEIAAAAEGKNDNKIDTLRQRYEDAGCDEGG